MSHSHKCKAVSAHLIGQAFFVLMSFANYVQAHKHETESMCLPKPNRSMKGVLVALDVDKSHVFALVKAGLVNIAGTASGVSRLAM